MPLLNDFVAETAVNPGTGTTVNLGGAVNASFRTFAAVCPNGSQVYYTLSDEVAMRESGIGTFTTGSPNTLARTQVLSNTANTTARLNFTGNIFVMNWLPASLAVVKNALGEIQANANAINTGISSVGNAQLHAGDATHPGYVELLDAAGARAGYAGYSTGTELLLEKGGSQVGWLNTGTFRSQGKITALAGLDVTGTATVAGNITTTGGGQINASGAVSATGNVTAVSGRVRATFGAYQSGDGNAASLLGDWLNYNDGIYAIHRQPDGQIIQSGTVTFPTGFDWVAFGTAFPNACTGVWLQALGDVQTQPICSSVDQYTASSFHARVVRWNGTTWANFAAGMRWLATGY